METLFHQIKHSVTKDVTLTLPNTNHPFFINADSPFIGLGCVLFQKQCLKELQNFFVYLDFLLLINKNSTIYRELIGIVYSVTKY